MLFRLSDKLDQNSNRRPRAKLMYAAIELDKQGINYEVRRSVLPVDSDHRFYYAVAREVYLFIESTNPQQETLLNLVVGNFVNVDVVDSVEHTELPNQHQQEGWKSVYEYILKEIARGNM